MTFSTSTRVAIFFVSSIAVSGCATAVEDSPGFSTSHDGGTTDTSAVDHDAFVFDTAGSDAVVSEGGSDTSPTDSGKADTTTSDGSTGDTGVKDTGEFDSGVRDTGVFDTGLFDTGIIDTGFDAGITTVSFPTSTSTTYGAILGLSTLGAGGSSGYHFNAGDYVEQAYDVPAAVTSLDLAITMYDATAGCASGATNGFSVKLDGIIVGTFTWISTGGGTSKPINQKYTFAAITPIGGKITIRVEATTTVCSGGSNWNWLPGGTAGLR